MPSSAASSLFIISECHWAVACGSLADTLSQCSRLSPGVLLWLQKGSLQNWSVSPSSRLCPPSCPIFQAVFWDLKRYLRSDCDSSYTHTSTLSLSVPLLSSYNPPNAFRMWEMATPRGENECLSQEDVIWNVLRRKKKRNYNGEKIYFFCFVLFCFSISVKLAQVLTVISRQRSFGSHDKAFGKMIAL